MAGLTQRGDIFYIKGIENDKVGGEKEQAGSGGQQ